MELVRTNNGYIVFGLTESDMECSGNKLIVGMVKLDINLEREDRF